MGAAVQAARIQCALMKFISRIGAALLAIAFLAGVVYLGILSGRDARYVVWFGIASAILAPVGLTLFGYALSSQDRELIQRLAKVPEIDRLIAEAKSQEEGLRLLEAEHARLVDVVRLESRRQAIVDRTENLEKDAVRILRELDSLADESAALELQIGESPVSKEIALLRERVRAREEGDVIFRVGSRFLRIDSDIVKALPLGVGPMLLAYSRIAERLRAWLRRKRRTDHDSNSGT
jgi:hypothetical protein